MRKGPTITSIIAVKNGARFLAESIESVLSQPYSPLEVLVIDGDSQDNSWDIAAGYERVKVLAQKGGGIAAAYNQGIGASTGDLICFNSADDIWEPQKIAVQLKHMQANTRVQFVNGLATFFLHEGCEIPPGFRKELLIGAHSAVIMETLMVRRSVFETIGLFDTSLATAEDVDWFARARDVALETAIVDAPILRKRIHSANSSMARSNTSFLLAALHKSVSRKRSVEVAP